MLLHVVYISAVSMLPHVVLCTSTGQNCRHLIKDKSFVTTRLFQKRPCSDDCVSEACVLQHSFSCRRHILHNKYGTVAVKVTAFLLS